MQNQPGHQQSESDRFTFEGVAVERSAMLRFRTPGLRRAAKRAVAAIVLSFMIAGSLSVMQPHAANAATGTAASSVGTRKLPPKTHHTPSLRVVADRLVARRIMHTAASRKGTPYRWGGTTPSGFDCSGYTRWVFAKLGVSLPHSSGAQVGRTIRTRHPKVGDLVFFSHGGHVYHVAIYAGHNQIWHAPYTGTRVRKDRIWSHAGVFYGHVKGLKKAHRKALRQATAARAARLAAQSAA